MASPAKPTAAKADPGISLTLKRAFDASPEAVFKAWTDPAQVARWIGPRGVKATVEKMEARVGGTYRIVMHRDSGPDPIVEGVFRELTPGRRLVFTWSWLNEAGKPMHETLVTLEFRPVGQKTEMTLLHEKFDSAESRDSHTHGWHGSFDKLTELNGQQGADPG